MEHTPRYFFINLRNKVIILLAGRFHCVALPGHCNRINLLNTKYTNIKSVFAKRKNGAFVKRISIFAFSLLCTNIFLSLFMIRNIVVITLPSVDNNKRFIRSNNIKPLSESVYRKAINMITSFCYNGYGAKYLRSIYQGY